MAHDCFDCPDSALCDALGDGTTCPTHPENPHTTFWRPSVPDTTINISEAARRAARWTAQQIKLAKKEIEKRREQQQDEFVQKYQRLAQEMELREPLYRVGAVIRQVEPDDIERLATLAHTIWANWTRHMLNNSDFEHIERWERQSNTLYEDLSEEEKESDRDIVRLWLDEILAIAEDNGDTEDT